MIMPRTLIDHYCIRFSDFLVNRTVFNIVDESLPFNCEHIQHAVGSNKDGVYTIYPSGVPLSVYCDLTTDGGGWTVSKHVYLVLCVFNSVFLCLNDCFFS